MMLVPWPVSDASAIPCTGLKRVEVKYSVMTTTPAVTRMPITAAKKIFQVADIAMSSRKIEIESSVITPLSLSSQDVIGQKAMIASTPAAIRPL